MSTTTAITAIQAGPVLNFSADQVELIKRTICKGATDDELQLFLYQCKRTGLDPLARQIYAVKRWDSSVGREVMAIQTAIDGFRLTAERTAKYAGQEGPFWCGKDGKWVDVWLSDEPPAAAKVGILRTDFSKPIWGIAKFTEYRQTKKGGELTKFWKDMPANQLAKCAEALGFRKAFPQELGNIYSDEEMQQADVDSAPAGNGHSVPKALLEPGEWLGVIDKVVQNVYKDGDGIEHPYFVVYLPDRKATTENEELAEIATVNIGKQAKLVTEKGKKAGSFRLKSLEILGQQQETTSDLMQQADDIPF